MKYKIDKFMNAVLRVSIISLVTSTCILIGVLYAEYAHAGIGMPCGSHWVNVGADRLEVLSKCGKPNIYQNIDLGKLRKDLYIMDGGMNYILTYKYGVLITVKPTRF